MGAIETDPHPDIIALLNSSGVNHRVVRHADLGTPIHSPADVAGALRYDVGRITKALLLKSSEHRAFLIAVLRADGRADLRVLADRVGATRCSMATREEVERALGLPFHGVSPLAARNLPVFLYTALRQCQTVLVGGGSPGVEVEVSPHDLARLSAGEWVAFGKPGPSTVE
jgi:Cys-tRNA(Pro)/Cys-tRNA(Cys) deacylase